MSDRTIARRYASALYEEALSKGAVERVDSDVALLNQAATDSRDLRLLFASPVVSTAKKGVIIRRLFEEHVSELVLSFLLLVTQKGREPLVPLILDEYQEHRLDQQGIVKASARVAVPMTASEKEDLRQSISSMIDKDVHLTIDVEADLIGGVVVKMGDRVYDGSLKSKLALMRRQLQARSNHRN